MFMLNDKPLPLDTPFTVGEGDEAIQYPANWLRLSTTEEKAAIGITEVADAEGYDDRFYWGVGVPKDLEQLKQQWQTQIKQTANSMLSATDWMIIRKAERDVALPKKTVAERSGILVECSRLSTAIEAAMSVEELSVVLNTQEWTKTENGQPTII